MDIMKVFQTGLTESMYGFNDGVDQKIMQSAKNKNVKNFLTKPQLNLSTHNIMNVREFYKLLNTNVNSVENFVRCTLDPRMMYGEKAIKTELVNKRSPFIPLFTNTVKTISGWPDEVVAKYTSKSGVRKEQYSMVDSTYKVNDVFDLSMSLSNVKNEPSMLLFQTWMKYASLVFEGMLYPYPDFIVANEIDYNTRLYSFTLDNSGRYISNSALTGAAFPSMPSTGKIFDFTREETFNTSNKTLDITLTCMGAEYNEEIGLLEFNKLNGIFNKNIDNFLKGNNHNLQIVPNDLKELLNHKAYPIINLKTYELVWVIENDDPILKMLEALSDNELEDEVMKKQIEENNYNVEDDLIDFENLSNENTQTVFF